MEKAHFEQAKLWLEGAKYISDFESMKRDAEKFLKMAGEVFK